MRNPRLMSLPLSLLSGGVLLVGCGSGASTERSTSVVTVTADTTAVGTTSAGPETSAGPTTSPGPETSPGDPTTAGTPTSAGDPTSAGTTESMAPIVTVDPLKADCTKVLNPTELGKSFGQLPAGTDRILEAANPEREITGRLKCQYGVDGSSIAVQVVLAQFTSQQAAQTQMDLTATSERQAGAVDSTTTVMGHPANVLLRDGGLLVVGYDTWTLSVVAADGLVSADALPGALEAIAEYSLDQVIVNG